MNWTHIVRLGLLGGIGFTMSLFVVTLCFGEISAALDMAKRCVIVGSLMAGILGFGWLRWIAR